MEKVIANCVRGNESEDMAQTSVFTSITEISNFFKGGADGYPPTQKQSCLQGLCLHIDDLNIKPFKTEKLKTTYLQNTLN